MEKQYIELLTIYIDDDSKETLTETTIRIGWDDENDVTYHINTLW